MRRRHVLGGGLAALAVTCSEKTAHAFIAVILGCLTALAHVALPAAPVRRDVPNRARALVADLGRATPSICSI